MKLLAIISHKGGVGKTTSAVLLAEELAAKGYRTLMVDADRQQGAGLLLEVGTPTGERQPTSVPGLDYLGSGRLSESEVAMRAAVVADHYDIGVVDTPSLDDTLAQAWLQQATAALMIMQVEPLTVKTFPSALATMESVRRLNPLIEIMGLLPTMFDPAQETHRTCLTELLTRRPESVFTPVVPSDAGLMHRAAGAGAPEISAAARQSYQCAADRVIRVLTPSRRGSGAGVPFRAMPPTAGGVDVASGPSATWHGELPPAAVTNSPTPARGGGWGERPAPPVAGSANGYAAPSPSAFENGNSLAGYPGVAGSTPAGPPMPPAGHAPSFAAAQHLAPPPPHFTGATEAWSTAQPPHGSAGPPAFGPVTEAPPGPYPYAPAHEHPAASQWAAAGAPPTTHAQHARGGLGGAVHPSAAGRWDDDQQAPDWWQAEATDRDGQTARRPDGQTTDLDRRLADSPSRRSPSARARTMAPFCLGFAAACVLLLLAWVGGAFRRLPWSGPQTPTAPAFAAPGGKAPRPARDPGDAARRAEPDQPESNDVTSETSNGKRHPSGSRTGARREAAR